jgi:hypothetical protein
MTRHYPVSSYPMNPRVVTPQYAVTWQSAVSSHAVSSYVVTEQWAMTRH